MVSSRSLSVPIPKICGISSTGTYPRSLLFWVWKNDPGCRYEGIDNYACRTKIENYIKNGTAITLPERLAGLYLFNWSQRASGELEEVSYWMKQNYPVLNRLVYEVSCSKEDCLEEGCKYQSSCFYLEKLAAMRKAHICTINHSLLIKWPWDYPELKRLVIDEAHNIEGAAYDNFSNQAS